MTGKLLGKVAHKMF